jgi:hypothetical protein
MNDTTQNGKPDPNDDCVQECEGTIDAQGSINLQGRIMMQCDCCGCRFKTKTTILQVPPQTEQSFDQFLQTQVDNIENSGKLVIAHSIVDAGAGWIVGLTVGEWV